jgi:transposase
VRDWVVRFNAHGPEALIDGKAPGPACKLQACHREALLALVESGPTPAVHGVVRWRLKDLVQWVWDEFRIAVSETTLGRELRTLGYRKLSARPRHHAKSEAAVAAFKKSFLRVWRKSRPTRPLASRSRSGLPMRRASARRTRSHAVGPNAAPAHQRRAICAPRQPTSSVPSARHLAEIAQAVTPGSHAVLLLDQAGWHVSRKLKVPPNITLLPLPAKAPELNPVENIWQFMRENWISNRIFTSYTDILDHCCAAWTKLVDQPWTIMSIGLRDWANA